MTERAERLRSYRIVGELTKEQRQIVSIGFIAAIILAFVAYAAGRPAWIEMEWSRQLKEAEIADGTILGKRSSSFGQDGDTRDFYIIYRLDHFANGTDDPRYIRESRIREERYDEFEVGDVIPVRYSPADPTMFLAQETYNNLSNNYIVFACSVCLVGIAIIGAIFGFLSLRFDTKRLIQDMQANPERFKP